MLKKGQMQISFGVIFSIIIIIATLAVAGYVLANFVSLGTKISCKTFYSDLQDEVKKAWFEDNIAEIYSEKTPPGVTKVCFGNLSQSLLYSADIEVYENLKFYSNLKSNFFFYPINVCDSSNFDYQIEHSITDGFFCIPVEEERIKIRLTKSSFDPLVKISK